MLGTDRDDSGGSSFPQNPRAHYDPGGQQSVIMRLGIVVQQVWETPEGRTPPIPHLLSNSSHSFLVKCLLPYLWACVCP